MNIPELIARQNRMNISNVKLAERLGVTVETFSRYRNGHYPLPPDLDARLTAIEQAHEALHADNKPTSKKRLAYWDRYTLDLEFIPRHACDKWGDPLLPAGSMYWEYWTDGPGFLRRRTREGRHHTDGFDGIHVPPSWVGLDLPGAADYPYELHLASCTLP